MCCRQNSAGDILLPRSQTLLQRTALQAEGPGPRLSAYRSESAEQENLQGNRCILRKHATKFES